MLAMNAANTRPVLTLNKNKELQHTQTKGFSYYLNKLSYERGLVLEEGLINLCIAYYGNGNWKQARAILYNKFSTSHRTIAKYISIIDAEIIEIISKDLISVYTKDKDAA